MSTRFRRTRLEAARPTALGRPCNLSRRTPTSAVVTARKLVSTRVRVTVSGICTCQYDGKWCLHVSMWRKVVSIFSRVDVTESGAYTCQCDEKWCLHVLMWRKVVSTRVNVTESGVYTSGVQCKNLVTNIGICGKILRSCVWQLQMLHMCIIFVTEHDSKTTWHYNFDIKYSGYETSCTSWTFEQEWGANVGY